MFLINSCYYGLDMCKFSDGINDADLGLRMKHERTKLVARFLRRLGGGGNGTVMPKCHRPFKGKSLFNELFGERTALQWSLDCLFNDQDFILNSAR